MSNSFGECGAAKSSLLDLKLTDQHQLTSPAGVAVKVQEHHSFVPVHLALEMPHTN